MDALTAEYIRKSSTIAGYLRHADSCRYLATAMAREIKTNANSLLFMADDTQVIRRTANRIKRRYALKAVREMLTAIYLLRAGSRNYA